MLHAAVVLLLLQDASGEVARQVARITSKDPRASMDAVSRLSDLAATSREAVQAAAAKLPDELSFYRTVLQEELRVRERLAGTYPKLKRASIEARDQTGLAVINEMATKFGEKLDVNNFGRGAVAPAAPAGPALTFKLDDVSYMEALEAVCRQGKLGLYSNGSQLMLNPFQENVALSAFRNFLVLVPTATRSRRIEFGAGETRSLRFSLNLFWDSDTSVARIVKVQVVEALDGKGKAIPPLPEEPMGPETPRKEGDPVLNIVNRFNQFEIALTMTDADKISRLRGFYETLVPTGTSAFDLTDLEKEPKLSDDHYEVQAVRKVEGGAAQILLRVRPKGSMDELIKAPVELQGVFDGGAEVSLFTSGRVTEGRLEYPVVESNRQLGQPQVIKGLKLRIARSLVERRIPFEFCDIALK